MKTMEKRSVMLHNLENARAVILQSDWETLYFIVFPKVLPVRSSPSELLVGKDVPEIYNMFTGGYPCRSEISIKLLCSFIEIALRHRCSRAACDLYCCYFEVV